VDSAFAFDLPTTLRVMNLSILFSYLYRARPVKKGYIDDIYLID